MFVVGKLLTFLSLPTALMMECTLLGLLLTRWLAGRVLLIAATTAQAACLVLPVDAWAIRPLEDRFPQVTTYPDRVDGIVVLGGALDELTSRDRDTPTLNLAANRLTTFVELARRYPQAKLLFTGDSGDIEQGASNEVEFAGILFTQLGLPVERVEFENGSRTTRESAVDAAALIEHRPGERWVLVTSASHMPRAVGTFRHAGWAMLPWPVGYQSRDHIAGYPQSMGHRLAVLDGAAHEWIGLLAYRVRGWTDSVFPGPD